MDACLYVLELKSLFISLITMKYFVQNAKISEKV